MLYIYRENQASLRIRSMCADSHSRQAEHWTAAGPFPPFFSFSPVDHFPLSFFSLRTFYSVPCLSLFRPFRLSLEVRVPRTPFSRPFGSRRAGLTGGSLPVSIRAGLANPLRVPFPIHTQHPHTHYSTKLRVYSRTTDRATLHW